MSISPLAPVDFPVLKPIAGVKLAAGMDGIRHKNRQDVLLAELTPGTTAAGVFTTSLTASAPVIAGQQAIKSGKARILVVNSGNSNAFTGKAGVAAVEEVEKAVTSLFSCTKSEFYMASTGVIGEKLPAEKITAILPGLQPALSDASWMDAAKAIMTTDTYPKLATRSIQLGGKTVTINGIAKGSGMIAPDMATMLAFIFTDAAIAAPALQTMLSEANGNTFNAITVDGDTSTSDTALLFATGTAGNPMLEKPDAIFAQALYEVLHELALHIVKDGEGAERLVTITVTGAESPAAARRIGMSIANSPLVKTAIAAGDANWGRIVAAVGKAGEKADRDKLSIIIGGVSVAKNGEADPSYQESLIDSHMKGRDIAIQVEVGIAQGTATVYTCDLTHRYIDINGSYRT